MCCKNVMESTDYRQVGGLRQFWDILEECCEVVAHDSVKNLWLWKLVKPELESRHRLSWYGNLYKKGIAAAKAAGDLYAESLEQEYLKWQKGCSLLASQPL